MKKVCLERAAGIEPAWLAWKARALPLSNARRWKAKSLEHVQMIIYADVLAC